ncbi:MAG TPA: hypothetical protein VMM56_17575 [Planctomycetaceae bacterium]|nr:hypothetical protein [Planctomycetaceae bacterium]
MRKLAIVLNSIVAVFFVLFLGYTFVARQHLEGLAREFVTGKTVQHSAPLVETAGSALDSPLVRKVLSDEQEIAIRREIDEYHRDPAAYIADLTRQKLLVRKPEKPNPLLEKVASIKERIRAYYDKTLAALIADLRIFAVSNLIAGVLALAIAYRSRERIQQSVVWFSCLMFVGVLYCSMLYIDDLTFFRILFRTHMGWWYPVLLCAVIARPQWEFGRAKSRSESSVAELIDF